MAVPKHLAIIMDGNGRWAQAKGRSRYYGHIRGARVARKIIEEVARLKIPHLTLFTFSTENWMRPKEEVHFLMTLLRHRLRRERNTLQNNNIKLHCVGDLSRLPLDLQTEIKDCIRETRQNTGLNLIFALNYGGRQEICQAVRHLCQRVKNGELEPADISEALVHSHLDSSFAPDPDLIIRTSGENRLSNFYLWQAAYSEIFISQRNWPEFSAKDLHQALHHFSQRERRFGRTSEQILQALP